jgi:radical SAM protein with 4Fe4S-binding SPASM domain
MDEEPDKVIKYAKLLEALDYGMCQSTMSFSEKFTPVIFQDHEEKNGIHRPLKEVAIEISNRCSLSCHYCGFRNGWTTSKCICGLWAEENDNITYDISSILEQLSFYPAEKLFIIGGDPFLNQPVLKKILTTASNKGLKVMVQSPAVEMAEEDWNLLIETNTELLVPIFGFNRPTTGSVTGYGNAFDALMKNINKARQKKYKQIFAKLVLTVETLSQRESIQLWLEENEIPLYSVEVFYPFEFASTLNAKNHQDIKTLFNNKPSNFHATTDKFMRLLKGHSCWQDKIAITLSGDVIPCIAARNHVIGNVNLELLLDILRKNWQNEFRNARKDLIPTCGNCEFRYSCTTCSLVTEDLLGTWKHSDWNCCYNPLTGEWNNPSILEAEK